jgi:hypothetical protein
MNWKIVLIGGVVFLVVTMTAGFGTGYVVHQNLLAAAYDATASFWRPELNQDPPDMAALMPMWVVNGLINSFIVAGIYALIRGSLAGSPAVRGLKYGVLLSLLNAGWMLGYWGVFNLPGKIWTWWALEATVLNLIAGLVLGIVAEKLAPSGAMKPATA